MTTSAQAAAHLRGNTADNPFLHREMTKSGTKFPIPIFTDSTVLRGNPTQKSDDDMTTTTSNRRFVFNLFTANWRLVTRNFSLRQGGLNRVGHIRFVNGVVQVGTLALDVVQIGVRPTRDQFVHLVEAQRRA